jgi:hypothetical protein
LNEDMGETCEAYGQRNSLPMFGPFPSHESRAAFASYVLKKWPIRIFTIDPVNNEQNIADASSVKRQMQLAVAIALASGEVGANTAVQTLRQLQRDTGTIELNRTVVGFTHGENTFGWRFTPRFQTPPVEGNAKVLLRDLVVGGPTDKQLKRTIELEPGMRECVAIVMMPSIISSAVLHSRSDWFKLNNPSETAVSVHDSVKLGKAVVSMRERSAECVRCLHHYRDGELERMLHRVDQLETKLPLQTMVFPVPIENALGGFELLSEGTRELAPELHGWYGAPGYDPSQDSTTFYLVGENFSVHNTSLMMGNRLVAFRLLSRQILEVTIPGGLPIVEDERLVQQHAALKLPEGSQRYRGFLDCHLATPYGVSGHLLIPSLQPSSAGDKTKSKQGFKIEDTSVAPQLILDQKGKIQQVIFQATNLPSVKLPEGFSIPLGKANIHLRLMQEGRFLKDVSYARVPQSADRSSYQIPAVDFEDSIADKGQLTKAISACCTDAEGFCNIDLGTARVLRASITVEFDNIEYPVQGQLIFECQPISN